MVGYRKTSLDSSFFCEIEAKVDRKKGLQISTPQELQVNLQPLDSSFLLRIKRHEPAIQSINQGNVT